MARGHYDELVIVSYTIQVVQLTIHKPQTQSH